MLHTGAAYGEAPASRFEEAEYDDSSLGQSVGALFLCDLRYPDGQQLCKVPEKVRRNIPDAGKRQSVDDPA